MKTPQEWIETATKGFPFIGDNPGHVYTITDSDIAAIQADARAGMVPVEKVKQLVAMLNELHQMAPELGRHEHGVSYSIDFATHVRDVFLPKALAAAKEMGVL